MATPIVIDSRQFNAKLLALIKKVPIEPEKVIRHQGALLVKELTDISLPKNISRTKESAKITIARAVRPSQTGAAQIPKTRYDFVRKNEGKRKTGRPVNVQPSAIKAFIKLQQDRIGLLAAGWIAKGNPLKASVKSRVSKQRAFGNYLEKKTLLGFSILITNSVAFGIKAFGGTYPKKVQDRVDKRARFMDALLKRWAKSGKVTYNLPASLR